MGREGLFDDTGDHSFDECKNWETCTQEAYEQGRIKGIEEFLIKVKEVLKTAMYVLEDEDFEILAQQLKENK